MLEVLCTRPLDHRPFPGVLIEATYVKSRVNGVAVYESVVTATGLDRDGGVVEALGVTVGDSEDASLWREFLLSLRVRGLHGVEIVASEDHGGLRESLASVFPDAAWESLDRGPVLRVSDEPFTGADTLAFAWRDDAGDRD